MQIIAIFVNYLGYDRGYEPKLIGNPNENAVLMLKAPEGVTGMTSVTVTVTDEDGNSFDQTFSVVVEPDEFNSTPYLLPFESDLETTVNTPIAVQLESFDSEEDPVEYRAEVAIGSEPFGLQVEVTSGLVIATPPPGFSGELAFFVGVFQAGQPADTVSLFDTQLVTIQV